MRCCWCLHARPESNCSPRHPHTQDITLHQTLWSPNVTVPRGSLPKDGAAGIQQHCSTHLGCSVVLPHAHASRSRQVALRRQKGSLFFVPLALCACRLSCMGVHGHQKKDGGGCVVVVVVVVWFLHSMHASVR